MTGTEVPPPPVPPQADWADPKLVTFIYLLARKVTGVGMIDHVVAEALKETGFMSNPELAAYATRIARTLTYTPLVQQSAEPGRMAPQPPTQEA